MTTDAMQENSLAYSMAGRYLVLPVLFIFQCSRWPTRPILGFWGVKFLKILPWTPMNRRAISDAASIILGGEIRNRTNKQTHKTVNDVGMRG